MSIAINAALPRPNLLTGVHTSALDKFLLFAMLLLMSGLFFLSDDHRYGFAFIRELLMALSIVGFFYVLIFERSTLSKVEFYLIFLSVLTFLVPPIFAYFYFQQPVYMGLMEERRTLSYLLYFLAMLVIGSRQYTPETLEKILLGTFVIGLLWSVACAYGFMPKNQAQFFSVNQEHFQEGFVSDDMRFETRFINGYFLTFLYPLYLIARGKTAKGLMFLSITACYLFFINQTRSLSASLGIAVLTLMFLRNKKDATVANVIFGIPALFFVGYLLSYFYFYALDKDVLFYDNYRNLEFGVVFRDAVKDFFIPHGNLSLHFGDRGFNGHFGLGINVYTADIGLAGSLFKYGLFYPLLLALASTVSYLVYKQYRNEFALIMIAYLIGLCVLMPFDDLLSTFGLATAILLLLAKAQQPKPRVKKYAIAIRQV